MRNLSLCPLLLSASFLFAETPGPAAPPSAPGAPALQAVPMGTPADPDRFAHLPRLLLDDTGQVLGAPMRWDRSDWLTAGLGVAAVVGTGLLFDHSLEQAVANHANVTSDRFGKTVGNFGGAPSVVIAGSMYLAGVAFKAPEVRATGIDTMATMGIAQLLLALPLKVLVGRSRPEANQGAGDFHLLNGGQSFPSSHTIQAFALASVISEHADRPWVTGLSYSLAGLVGLGRVEQRQHFLSDVVASGLIGTFVGKTVVAYNQSVRASASSKVSVSFAPSLQPGGYGLSLTMKF